MLLGELIFQLPTRKQILLSQYVISIVLIQWFGHRGHATAIQTKVMIQTIPTTCRSATAKKQNDIEFKPVQRILVEVLVKCTQASDPITPSLSEFNKKCLVPKGVSGSLYKMDPLVTLAHVISMATLIFSAEEVKQHLRQHQD